MPYAYGDDKKYACFIGMHYVIHVKSDNHKIPTDKYMTLANNSSMKSLLCVTDTYKLCSTVQNKNM